MRKFSGALKSHSRPAGTDSDSSASRGLFAFSFGITRQGVLYLIFVLLLSLTAVNTGNNLLYIIFATLLSIIVVSGILSRNTMKQVSLSLQMPENVFVGEKVSIKISMTNRKRALPSISMRVEDPGMYRQGLRRRKFLSRVLRRPDAGGSIDRNMFRQAAYFPILRPGETRSELILQSFPRRGLYSLQGFWISTRFPFGFFQCGEHIAARGEVLVYPPVQEVASFFRLLPFLPGKLESRHAGAGESLFALREYQEGESARIIDWKATAKTGTLMAREYAREEENKFCLILDTHRHPSMGAEAESRFERAVSLAASLAAHFMEEGAGLEFLTPQRYVPRGTGIEHLYRILRALAVVNSAEAAPPGDAGFRHFGDYAAEENPDLQRIFSDRIFKIILTSQPRGAFPAGIWRSSHVIFFDEL